jgi:hypothetical protein
MMVPGIVATVENVRYVEDKKSVFGSSLRIDLANGKALYVPNGGFTADNPALCVLAFLGARPSDLEAAEGEDLPYALDPKGNLVVPPHIVQRGNRMLEDTEWGP